MDRSVDDDMADLEDLEDLELIEWLSSFDREPYSTPTLSGQEYLTELLNGPPYKFHRMFRMNPACFMSLCQFLKDGNYVEDTESSSRRRRVSFEESVAIFLLIVGHSNRQRQAADRFPHSTHTINKHFAKVLKGLATAAIVLITPPDPIDIHERITGSEDFNPWFQGALGAVDGTLVDAWAPAAQQNTCRSRKGNITQNVLAICDFEMMFTFVYAGWEGSANDSRVIQTAISQGLLQIPANDRYYLVDCGYPNMPGFLAPYRGEPYHAQDFQGANNAPTGHKQLFNKQHARLRNVIERTFGVFKKRFPIFKSMSNYTPTKQVDMVIACCAVHNFIGRHSKDDTFFVEGADDELGHHQQNNEIPSTSQGLDMSAASLNRMGRKRDQIAVAMWNARH